MTGRNIILIILFLALLGGIYSVFIAGQSQTSAPKQEETKKTIEEQAEKITGDKVKTFVVTGKPFEFDPKEIRVKQGDTVKIEFRNTEGFHDLTIDEFNVKTDQIQAGQSDSIEFVAQEKGTFEFFCGVGNHRAMGMVGKLIVE